MKRCFLIHPCDNVATLVEDADRERLLVVGAPTGATVAAVQAIPLGHKVALAGIEPDGEIVKYGVVIGLATRPIAPGEWVHLHNCRSRLDERSAGLDLHTGAAQDTAYE
jgi:altronate dehydratase